MSAGAPLLLPPTAADGSGPAGATDGLATATAGSGGPKVKGSIEAKRLASCTEAGGGGGVGE